MLQMFLFFYLYFIVGAIILRPLTSMLILPHWPLCKFHVVKFNLLLISVFSHFHFTLSTFQTPEQSHLLVLESYWKLLDQKLLTWL